MDGRDFDAAMMVLGGKLAITMIVKVRAMIRGGNGCGSKNDGGEIGNP